MDSEKPLGLWPNWLWLVGITSGLLAFLFSYGIGYGLLGWSERTSFQIFVFLGVLASGILFAIEVSRTRSMKFGGLRARLFITIELVIGTCYLIGNNSSVPPFIKTIAGLFIYLGTPVIAFFVGKNYINKQPASRRAELNADLKETVYAVHVSRSGLKWVFRTLFLGLIITFGAIWIVGIILNLY